MDVNSPFLSTSRQFQCHCPTALLHQRPLEMYTRETDLMNRAMEAIRASMGLMLQSLVLGKLHSSNRDQIFGTARSEEFP